MPFVDTAIRTAKPGEKPYKLADEKGLFLLVNPNEAKRWRLKFRFAGKEKLLSFGTYPEVGLKEARRKRDDARKLLADGVDPGETRKAQKATKNEWAANCFEVIAKEWLAVQKITVSPGQYDKTLARFQNDVFPWIGARPISEITAPEVLSVLRRIDARGACYTAHRCRGQISQVMRYAIATGRAERDPCPDLKGAIPSPKSSNFASITEPDKVAEMLRAFDGFKGTFVVKCALEIAPRVFVRSCELCKAEWVGTDLDKAEWRYLVKPNTRYRWRSRLWNPDEQRHPKQGFRLHRKGDEFHLPSVDWQGCSGSDTACRALPFH